jgi:hypothetical protein
MGLDKILVFQIINRQSMSDNKKSQGTQDDIRVDANDPSEVEYLHRQFPEKTHQEIKDAIKAKGPLRKNIEDYLRKNQ